jgi:hypothetical protein
MPYEIYCVNPRENAFDVYQWSNQIRLGYRAAWNSAAQDDYEVDILEMVDGQRMIDTAIDRSFKRKRHIDAVYFVGHGWTGGMHIGRTALGPSEVDSVPSSKDGKLDFRPLFQRLGRRVANGGAIYFLACNMGKQPKTLKTIARLADCTVYGCDYSRVGGDSFKGSANLKCTGSGCQTLYEPINVGKYVSAKVVRIDRATDQAWSWAKETANAMW